MSCFLRYHQSVLFLLNFSVRNPIANKFRTLSTMKIETVEKGTPNTDNFRIFFKSENGFISPFHDIPLYHNFESKIVNMVVEIPRWTNAKMEICLSEPLNPIKQDIKKGKLRYVANVFPHHGYIWNYGALPQTWENPKETDSHTGQKGDGDPIDVIEIGERVAKRGEVIQVKVLGVVGLIDEGQTDWKIIAINVNDPNADKVNDVGDIEIHFPGYLKATNEWFKIYKIPDGKPENVFALNGEAKNKEFALNVITDVNNQWKKLIQAETKVDDISILNTNVADSPGNIKYDKAEVESNINSIKTGPGKPLDSSIDKSFFIHLK